MSNVNIRAGRQQRSVCVGVFDRRLVRRPRSPSRSTSPPATSMPTRRCVVGARRWKAYPRLSPALLPLPRVIATYKSDSHEPPRAYRSSGPACPRACRRSSPASPPPPLLTNGQKTLNFLRGAIARPRPTAIASARSFWATSSMLSRSWCEPRSGVHRPGLYQSSGTLQDSRKAMVYQAANDGMLHAYRRRERQGVLGLCPEPRIRRPVGAGLAQLSAQVLSGRHACGRRRRFQQHRRRGATGTPTGTLSWWAVCARAAGATTRWM